MRLVRQFRFTLRIVLPLSVFLICASRTMLLGQFVSPTSLVSVDGAGTGSGNDDSEGAVISSDGRYVLFTSFATNLVSNSSSFMNHFVRDLQTGTTIALDVDRSGTGGGNGPSSSFYLSTTGRYVAFQSYATNLVAAVDNNGTSDVFVRDLQTGVTTLVSVNRFGTSAGNDSSYSPKVSADGRFVIFTSMATDLVENYRPGEQGLFVRDMLAGTTTLIVSGVPESHIIINKSNLGLQPQSDRIEVQDYRPILSANSGVLAFSCYSDLVFNDPGNPPTKGYLRDLYAGTTKPVRFDTNGLAAEGTVLGLSADGRFVLWNRDIPSNIVQPFSFRNTFDLYVRDMLTQEAKLVTISPDRKSDARNSDGNDVLIHNAAISGDGRYVVFVTRATNLAPEKTTIDFEDIFVRDTVNERTKVVSINAWGTASGNRQSWLPRISGDGRFITFYSRASDLVFNDNNDVPGGFGTEDVFVRDMQLGITTLASLNYTGMSSGNGWSENPNISTDGRRVVFTSLASDLVPYDTHGVKNIYAYMVPTQFGEIQFSAPGYQASESDGSATITVTRIAGSEGGVSVDYVTSGGTASSSSNYTPAVGTLHFFPGEVTKTFKVLITDDSIANGDRTINLSLSTPSGGVTLGAQKTATLTIKDNDASTSGVNPIDDTRFFVRQHYLDFLNREPDDVGLQFWTNEIEQCGANTQCRQRKRINVSAAFILSTEFQESGFLVYRMYKAAYNRAPTYSEFVADTQAIGQGVVVGAPGWETQLELNKHGFANAFVNRPALRTVYRSVWELVDAVSSNTGVTPSSDLRFDLYVGKETPATVFLKISDDPTFSAKQFNSAFVLMQYFGYLRRNPNDPPDSDFSGYNFWLNKLNQFGGNYNAAEMVKAFIDSTEYRQRFGP